jgi:hypothetical protein
MLLSNSADTSGPIPAAELCSPPRGWPERFSQDRALNSFIGVGRLRGKRCRLTSPPPGRLFDEAAAAGGLPAAGDSRANAEALHAALGWPIIKGYAVFELAAQPGVFAALARQWNCVRGGVWVDLTPRPDAHASLVLVESEVEPEGNVDSASGIAYPLDAGGRASGAPQSPGGEGSVVTGTKSDGGTVAGATGEGVLTATGEHWRPFSSPQKAPSLSMLEQRERWQALASDTYFRYDVSTLRDQASLHSYLEALRNADDPKLQLIQTNAQAFAVLLDELTSGPVLPRPRGGARPSSDSGGGALSSDGGGGALAVRKAGTVVATSTKPEEERQAELHASMLGVWTMRKGVKHGRIRLQLRSREPAGPAISHSGGALAEGGDANAGAEVVSSGAAGLSAVGAAEAGAGVVAVAADTGGAGEGPNCHGGEFSLEAQSWSSLYDETDVPTELFAELEEDDESAAQMRCRGW